MESLNIDVAFDNNELQENMASEIVKIVKFEILKEQVQEELIQNLIYVKNR